MMNKGAEVKESVCLLCTHLRPNGNTMSVKVPAVVAALQAACNSCVHPLCIMQQTAHAVSGRGCAMCNK